MIGEFIKQQRIKREISQEEIALSLNMSCDDYRKIENGSRELTISEAKKLASIFNLSIEDFLKCQNQIRVVNENDEKCKHVILYVLNQVGSKPNIGETVLHKLLYFIDFDHYEKFEETLMGATYIKNRHGPTLSKLNSILKSMEKNHIVYDLIVSKSVH